MVIEPPPYETQCATTLTTPEPTRSRVMSWYAAPGLLHLPDWPRFGRSHTEETFASPPLHSTLHGAPLLPDTPLSEVVQPDRAMARLPVRPSTGRILPIDLFVRTPQDDNDDEMPLLTPSEGYTVAPAALPRVFSASVERNFPKDCDHHDGLARFKDDQPLPLLDIDCDDDDVSEDESTSIRSKPLPKLKMLSCRDVAQELQL
jgi:hypothetical protein